MFMGSGYVMDWLKKKSYRIVQGTMLFFLIMQCKLLLEYLNMRV